MIYSLFVSERRPTLNDFASTCALEALFLAIPYALGDQIALSAMLLKPLAVLGFGGRIIGWLGICGLIVFPPAFFAGIQFPILLGLLGIASGLAIRTLWSRRLAYGGLAVAVAGVAFQLAIMP